MDQQQWSNVAQYNEKTAF